MATLSRPQLVLRAIAEAWATHTSLEVTKTATMSFGTLLKADGTEATAAELVDGAYDVGFIIDDAKIADVADGSTLLARCVSRPEWTVLRGEELKLGATALSAAELALFVAGSMPVDVQ
ncbi:putative head stabilization/decoration protein [Vibrio phage 424E50-1]|nr:putative head stabilization/decoration protein [Vibrio phage 424E50-1]